MSNTLTISWLVSRLMPIIKLGRLQLRKPLSQVEISTRKVPVNGEPLLERAHKLKIKNNMQLIVKGLDAIGNKRLRKNIIGVCNSLSMQHIKLCVLMHVLDCVLLNEYAFACWILECVTDPHSFLERASRSARVRWVPCACSTTHQKIDRV